MITAPRVGITAATAAATVLSNFKCSIERVTLISWRWWEPITPCYCLLSTLLVSLAKDIRVCADLKPWIRNLRGGVRLEQTQEIQDTGNRIILTKREMLFVNMLNWNFSCFFILNKSHFGHNPSLGISRMLIWNF